MLGEDTLVTGDDAGLISIWSHLKKKPTHTLIAAGPGAATREEPPTPSAKGKPPAPLEGPRVVRPWVVSLGSARALDLVASGSSDGVVRLWEAKVAGPKKSLRPVGAVPAEGFVNGLAVASDGRFLAVCTGQEHRMGRWERNPKAKNALAIIRLPTPE